MSDTPTIKDIAQKAGVSVGTVSGVLNNKGNFSEDTKERVWAVANELCYKPNQDAKKLRAGGFGSKLKTNIIMYISNVGESDPSQTPLDRMCLSLLSWEAQKQRLFMTKLWYDGKKGFSCPPILNGLVDGVILATPYKDSLEILKEKDIPIVLMDSPFHSSSTDTPTVSLNFRKGILEMFEKLKALGHKNIGVCFSPSVQETQAYGAIIEASTLNGITIQGEFLKPLDGLSAQTHDKVMKDFADFAEGFIRGKKISAIICANDCYACTLHDIFKDKGLRMPEDLSLIGTGRAALDMPESPVAAIVYDWPEMARASVDLLKNVMDDPKGGHPVEILIPPLVYDGKTLGKAI